MKHGLYYHQGMLGDNEEDIETFRRYRGHPITHLCYRLYTYRIFPHITHVRGATCLNHLLDQWTRRGLPPYTGTPTPITDLDWDHLIILDGCRHDLYQEVNGQTDSRVTVGSTSPEYIENTFTTGDWTDTVLVTANPHFHPSEFTDLTGRQLDDVFHHVDHLYLDRWDDDHGTVLPSDVLNAAITAADEYPDKQLIVHFMQPHHPFLTADLDHVDTDGFGNTADDNSPGGDIWAAAEHGTITRSEAWNGYRDNLEHVMQYVHSLVDHLSGRVVVTADHGNLVGENGRYGHPYGSRAQVLREVPWDVIRE